MIKLFEIPLRKWNLHKGKPKLEISLNNETEENKDTMGLRLSYHEL